MDNVIVKDNKSKMKAETITLDMITKDININSKEKIKSNNKLMALIKKFRIKSFKE